MHTTIKSLTINFAWDIIIFYMNKKGEMENKIFAALGKQDISKCFSNIEG